MFFFDKREETTDTQPVGEWYEVSNFQSLLERIAHLTSHESKLKLIKLIANYLTYEEACNSLLMNVSCVRNDQILMLIDDIDQIAGNRIIRKYYGVAPDDRKYYTDGLVFDEDYPKVTIPDKTLLLNAWNGHRVLNSLEKINKQEVFDVNAHAYNINNYYITPLNLLICDGANHSQLSALLGEDAFETFYRVEWDISPLYDYVKFDGEFKLENDPIKFNHSYHRKILFYTGILFELGRSLR